MNFDDMLPDHCRCGKNRWVPLQKFVEDIHKDTLFEMPEPHKKMCQACKDTRTQRKNDFTY